MSFSAFLFAAIVLALTPGPGIAYVVAGGRPESRASLFGTSIGGKHHVLAAALGLSLIIAQSTSYFRRGKTAAPQTVLNSSVS